MSLSRVDQADQLLMDNKGPDAVAKWVILVSGYGAFFFDGTPEDAEKMRAHKANWEGGIGKKRRATMEEILAGDPSECWNHAGFNNRYTYADCGCSACNTGGES